MKKILTKTITLLVAIVLSIGAFAGCGIVTTNQDRDMNQVVASLSIGNGNSEQETDKAADIHKDYILKKELVAGYMSYGYMYVQKYSYTVSKAYATVLDRLVQSNVVVQQAKIKLAQYYIDNKNNSELDGFAKDYIETMAKNNASATKAEDIYNAGISEAEYEKLSKAGDYAKLAEYLELYLSEYEVAQAKYNVLSSISSMIKSYKTEEDTEENEKETITVTARTAPSEHSHSKTLEIELKEERPEEYDKKVVIATLGEKVDQATIDKVNACETTYDLNKCLYDNYKLDLADNASKTALNKAIKQLKKNGVIGSDESHDNGKQEDVVKYSYFQYMLKSQYESLIVTKYENQLKYDAEKQIKSGESALKQQFIAEYNSQAESYLSDYTAYETALNAATEEKGVYCNPYEGYGYVLNLLIGFTDEQTAVLKEQDSKAGISNADKLNNRAAMLNNLVAKDQRETWVKSSYGKAENDTFTFDSDYVLSGKSELMSYVGKALLKEAFDDKDDKGVEKTSYSFKGVYANAIAYSEFETEYLKLAGMNNYAKFDENDATTVHMAEGDLEENIKVFNDLMYAFSTDTGCLGKTYGYLYSPKTSATQYVPEFAAAAKAVVEAGEGAYTIVATQYGYHVILCTKKIAKDESAEKVFEELMKAADEEHGYSNTKVDSVLSDYITKISNRLVNSYIKKAEYVSKAYSDLIESADDPATANK